MNKIFFLQQMETTQTKPKRQYRKKKDSEQKSPETSNSDTVPDIIIDTDAINKTENTAVPKERKRKYETKEAAHQAKIEQMRQWRQNRKAKTLTIDFGSEELKNEFLELMKNVPASDQLKNVLQHLVQ